MSVFILNVSLLIIIMRLEPTEKLAEKHGWVGDYLLIQIKNSKSDMK